MEIQDGDSRWRFQDEDQDGLRSKMEISKMEDPRWKSKMEVQDGDPRWKYPRWRSKMEFKRKDGVPIHISVEVHFSKVDRD
jgi:hypothetical protein